MANIQSYFIADLHFGHSDRILEWRSGFKSVEDMELTIVDNINSTVRVDDNLYLLGDIIITKKGFESFDKILCKNKYLILGNHDNERDGITFLDWKDKVKNIRSSMDITVSSYNVVASHIPVHMNSNDRWSYNIHGHLHEELIKDPRYINVSCEQVGYKPINKKDILEIIQSRGVVNCDNYRSN